MNIGERIKYARKKAKMTQTELAKKINKTFSTVQKYEQNIIQPPIDVINDISKALDVPDGYLLGFGALDPVLPDNMQGCNLTGAKIDESFLKYIIGNLFFLDRENPEYSRLKNDIIELAEASELSEKAQEFINEIEKKEPDKFYIAFAKGALGEEGFTSYNKKRLNEAYDKLNEKGQTKAVENVVDLTKIEEYRKS